MASDTTNLLDTNFLVALIVADHVHHVLAEEWFARDPSPFATCPTTQSGLLRFLVREGATAAEALGVLNALTGSEHHEFWPDDLGFRDVTLAGIVSQRQVTDSYLAGLARARDSRLVTLDRGLAAIHPDVVDLVGTLAK